MTKYKYKYISFAYPTSDAAQHYGVNKTGGYFVSTQERDIQSDGIQYRLPEYGSAFAYRKLRDAVAAMASVDGEHLPFMCHTRDMTAEQIYTCAIDYTGRPLRHQRS